MPSAQKLSDGASGILVGAGGRGMADKSTSRLPQYSRFVLCGNVRLQVGSTVPRGRLSFWLDAQIRACIRSSSACSARIGSEADKSVDASPTRSVPADSRAGA